MERVALVVERQRVPRPLYPSVQVEIAHGERPDEPVDRPGQLVDRQPVGVHGVPQPDERDLERRVGVGLGLADPPGVPILERRLGLGLADSHDVPIARSSAQAVPGIDEGVAQRANGPDQPAGHGKPLAAIGAIRRSHVPRELGLVAVVAHQALIHHQADQNADGECAAAEPEGVDAVAGPVRPADERVQVAHVAGEAHAKRAAQQRQRLEGRGTNAVVVERELAGLLRILGVGQVDRLVDAPDVGLGQLARAVPRSIRAENDVPGHRSSGQDGKGRRAMPRPRTPYARGRSRSIVRKA